MPQTFKEFLSENINIPIANILISRNSLFAAMQDIERGQRTYSRDEPINLWQIKNQEYQLVDGYHRIFEILLMTNQHSVLATIVGQGYSDYYATTGMKDRFKYEPNQEFHGLENLADEEILEELKEKLS